MTTHQPQLSDLLDAYAMRRNEGLTPLTAIAGYSDLLLRGAFGQLTDDQLQAVTIIRQNVTLSLQSWNNYGDYLRAYFLPPQSESVDLSALLENVSAQTRTQAETIEVTLPDSACTIIGDSRQLYIAFRNLIYPDEPGQNIHETQPFIRVFADNSDQLAIFVRSGLVLSSHQEWFWSPVAALGIAEYVIKRHGGNINVEYGAEHTDYHITLPKAAQQ